MKLNNKLITSLAAFRCNFSFSELWNKIEIFKRDMSPNVIEYSDDDIALYDAICSPSSFAMKDGVLCDAKGQRKFYFEPLAADEMRKLESISEYDRVLVAAITRLARVKITNEISQFFSATINIEENGHKLVLDGGRSLYLMQKPTDDIKLRYVLISVSKTSAVPSIVGYYRLQPGESVYGVFCGNKLIASCPHEAKNSKYKLVMEDGVGLAVYERSSGNLEVVFNNARYFTMVNDDNFAIVDGRNVRTYQDTDLNRRIRNIVNIIKNPVMVDCDGKNIIVTYEDGSEENIEI